MQQVLLSGLSPCKFLHSKGFDNIYLKITYSAHQCYKTFSESMDQVFESNRGELDLVEDVLALVIDS